MQLLREATTESSRCQLKTNKKKAQPKSAELCLIWNITEDFRDYNFSEDCFKEK